MLIKLLVLFCLLLQGCAASRGFWVGALTGPLVVDECVHNEVDVEKPAIHVKVAAHQAILASTAFVLWPFAAAYMGASGIYGAYRFQSEGK